MRVEAYLMAGWLGVVALAGAAQPGAPADVSEVPPSLDFLEFLGGLVEVGDELLGPEDIEDMALPGEDQPDRDAEAPIASHDPRSKEGR